MFPAYIMPVHGDYLITEACEYQSVPLASNPQIERDADLQRVSCIQQFENGFGFCSTAAVIDMGDLRAVPAPCTLLPSGLRCLVRESKAGRSEPEMPGIIGRVNQVLRRRRNE